MFFHLDDPDEMLEKPNIDVGQCVHFIDGQAAFEMRNAGYQGRSELGIGEFRSDGVAVGLLVGAPEVFAVTAKSKTADFEAPKCFLE